jgi:hypothetical protein
MKQRTQADDLKDQIKLLELDLNSVNSKTCPIYCYELKQEIMELRSILFNIR